VLSEPCVICGGAGLTRQGTRCPVGCEPSLAAQEYLALQELLALQEKKQAVTPTAAKYLDDPLGFVDNCVTFPARRVKRGQEPKPGGLAPYQREIINSVPVKQRVAVRGPRGLGKSTTASLVILWFALTRDMAGIDWKIVTTAGAWQQLTDFLWPEIKKWAYLINWEQVGRGPLSERTELMKTGLTLKHGLATAGSPDAPQKLEGAHADSILYVLDESKLISVETFDAAEGAFSGAGDDSGLEAYALAISTPGEPSGRFYDIHRRAPGLEDWFVRHVTLDEAIAAGRMTNAWVEQRRRLWGTSSALFQNHVLGEFCADDEDAVIPLRWVEESFDRWRAWDSAGRPDPDGAHVLGVDVARSGKDKTVLAMRIGDVVTSIRSFAKEDTMETTGRVMAALRADPLCVALIDIIGIGAGVYDRCREQAAKVDPFHASKKTARKDRSQTSGFFNLRACAWWFLREQLDPSQPGGARLALPPDDELAGDLTSMHYKYVSDGKIQVESKEDIRKRIGRSTDLGDAVMQACFESVGSWLETYGLTKCPDEAKCGRGFAVEVNGKPRTHCPFCNTALDDGIGEEDAA